MNNLEKALAAAVEPLVDDIISLEKRIDNLKANHGADGVGIKAIEIAQNNKSVDFVLDNDQVVTIDLPEGPQGAPGEKGIDGKNGVGLDSPVWESGIYRKGDRVQHHIGQYFEAKADTASEPGASDDWVRLGTAGMRFCGGFKKDANYIDGDVYVKDYCTFLVVNGESKMLAKVGGKGDKGEPGKDADNEVVAKYLLTNPDFSEQLKQVSNGVDDFVVNEDGFAIITRSGEVHSWSLPAVLKQFLNMTSASAEDEQPPITRFVGSWDAAETYTRGDVVQYGQAIYVCYKSGKSMVLLEHFICLVTVSFAGGGGGGGSVGPAGPAGPAGEPGPQGIQGATGPAGPQGIQGEQGLQGPAGLGISFKGTVMTFEELPATAQTGDMYSVQTPEPATGYVYDAAIPAWVDTGPIQGPQGVQGPQGLPGQDLTEGAYLPLAGGTMTGTINVPNGINAINTASGFNMIGSVAGLYYRNGTANLFHLGVTTHQSFKPLLLPADPTLNLHAATKQYVDAKFTGGGYVLPIATNTIIGGVKVGTGLTIDAEGTLSAEAGSSYTLPAATSTVLGGVKVGTKSANQYVNGVAADGTLLWGSVSATGAPLRLPPTEVSTFNGVDSYWYMDPNGIVRLQMPGSTTGILIYADGHQQFLKSPVCNIAPVDGNHLANKTYVDRMLPLAGGTMTGTITLPTAIQSFTWGTTGYNMFGGSGGVAVRSSGTNLWITTSSNTTFLQGIVTQTSATAITFGSGGATIGRGSSQSKIKVSGQIELPTAAPVGDEAISKNYADATYAAKALFDEMRAEIDTLKAEVAALKGAA
jgi:hypothetical protein